MATQAQHLFHTTKNLKSKLSLLHIFQQKTKQPL